MNLSYLFPVYKVYKSVVFYTFYLDFGLVLTSM